MLSEGFTQGPGIVLGVSMTWGQADPKENKLLLSEA